MSPMVFVCFDGGAGGVGDEGVVPPLVEQGGLGAFDAGPSNDETVPVALGGLGDLGVT